MSEISISFKNYKLLKEGEINLSNGTIFFVQGPNNVGKTSFLNLLRSIMEVKDETENPVTFGEKEGFATGKIIGADGKSYQFRYDFNVDGKNKFQFVDENNRVIKTVGEMRDIFNYTHFTVEEFFDWSKSVPGRKKQRDIFMKLLTDKERVDIEDIDKKINTTNGEFIESRKNLNREVDFLKKRIDSVILSVEQKNLYADRVNIQKLFAELTEQQKQLESTLSSTEVFEAQIKAKNDLRDKAEQTFNEYMETSNKEIDGIEAEISRLQRQLVNKKEEVETKRLSYKEEREKYDNDIKELSKKVDIDFITKTRDDLNLLNKRIESGKTVIEEIVKVTSIMESLEKDKAEYETKAKEAKEFDNKIETLREKKKEIIFKSNNIPAGWSLDDDFVTIDGIPFLETDISKSKATKAIANLMMKINKSPIMLMGDAESLGFEILNELEQQAKEHGKIMIFAEHLRSADELKLVCYDDIEHEVKTVKKELF